MALRKGIHLLQDLTISTRNSDMHTAMETQDGLFLYKTLKKTAYSMMRTFKSAACNAEILKERV
jgi:hypothetical protein